jgi:hypothetical protein
MFSLHLFGGADALQVLDGTHARLQDGLMQAAL